ncbi:CubicO group peptidase (beta-lactamase class C family) [Allonocardiopsis opalescens]|uniref:CubicO group peptidase (Beta-lactamase class C family) n=1 Tax=Allonocardiopsis opalescens TaxID=1144618 RepID=A0A2T0QCB4_9ACTN|nr:CubicO group peptidase (beta-lactamase class C family) [Allonocardiopsis opalescens]
MAVLGVFAVPGPAAGEVSTGAVGDELSARAAAEFVEGFVPAQLERYRIPGAAVSVVAGGERVLATEYGLAEVASGRLVDAEETAFAAASVAKVLTAAAVMQLVEDGAIELDTDVNAYLDFEVEDDFPGRPVTVAHLLTHTAGFAVRDSGTAAADPGDVRPLGVHLAEELPERVRPPGERAVYSNFGMALAGYLVERRSGLPFDRYVDDNILRPLGMDRTTFTQPTPSRVHEGEAVGHRLVDGRHVPAEGARYGHMPPHGAGFRTTAADMARFMGAMLDGGGGILRPDSVEQMLSRQFANASGTPGMGYGFQEYTRGGQRLLVHRGSIPGSFAVLALIPERRIGIYASYNGGEGGAADSAWDLVDAFADRFAPAGAAPGAGPRTATPSEAEEYAGTYLAAQIGDTVDLGRLAGLTNTVAVTAAPDGTLRTTGAVGWGPSQPRRWHPVAPGLFREENGHQTIRFGADGSLATGNPVQPLHRLAWYEHPHLHLGVVGAGLAVLAAAVPGWPLARAVRRLRNRPHRGPWLASVPGWAAAVLCLASAASVVAMFADFEGTQAAFFLGTSPLLTAIGILPPAAVPATVGAAAATVLAWRNAWWTRAGRIHHTVAVLACAAYLVWAFAYHVPALP